MKKLFLIALIGIGLCCFSGLPTITPTGQVSTFAQYAFGSAYIPDSYYTDFVEAVTSDSATRLYIVSDSSTPTDVSGSLGYVAVDSGDFTTDDGDTSGRKSTISAQEITATGTGTARHWVLTDETPTIINVGTMTEKAVTSGETYQFTEKNLTEARDAQ